MLKWVDETRCRKRTTGDISDTSSLSSFSSECSSVLADLPVSPIAQTRLRMLHRPASLAISPEQINIEWKTGASEISPVSPITFTKRESPSPTSSISRHSSFISNRFIRRSLSECSTNSHEVLKISTSPEILKVNTLPSQPKTSEKSKLATLWKNLTRRKPTMQTRLKKAQSMLEIPSIIPIKDKEMENGSPVERIFRSPSPTNSIASKNSLKNIKKKSENMKPKPFTRNSSVGQIDTSRRIFEPKAGENRYQKFNSLSRDSRNGSLDSTSLSSTDSSPEMRMKHKNFEQEFTNALLRIISMDEESEPECGCDNERDGDVFCYDSDTIIRKNQPNAEVYKLIKDTSHS